MSDILTRLGIKQPASLLQQPIPGEFVLAVGPPSAEEIYEYSRNALKDLENIVHGITLPNGQPPPWLADIQRHQNTKVKPINIGLVGRTGAGKSTVMNAIFGSRLLASSSEGACTSVTTIISYVDDRYIAIVHFISKEDLREFLEDAISDICFELEHLVSGGNLQEGTPAAQKRQKLNEIFPHVASKSDAEVSRWTEKYLGELVNHPTIVKYLGEHHQVPSNSPDDLHDKLRKFTTAKPSGPLEPAFWHLIQRVEIKGPIDVLKPGIQIFDVPGYGDTNEVRDKAANKILKTADYILLVADMKRAKDDKDMIGFMKSNMSRMMLDGRADDKSMILVLTGNDILSGDKEVEFNDPDARKQVEDLRNKSRQAMSDISDCQDWVNNHASSAAQNNEIKDVMTQLSNRIKNLREETRADEFTRSKIVARVKASNVCREIQKIYGEIWRSLQEGGDEQPPPLEIFCVGSRDFLCLSGVETTSPTVFSDKNDTAIPDLKEFIEALGECEALQGAKMVVANTQKVFAQVQNYFDSQHDQELMVETFEMSSSRVMEYLRGCLKSLYEIKSEKIQTDLMSLLNRLGSATEQAAHESKRIFAQLPRDHKWNTYVAILRHKGEFKDIDLNHALVETIEDKLARSFSRTLTVRIVEHVRQYFEELYWIAQDVVEAIRNEAVDCPDIARQIDRARQSINFDTERDHYITTCTKVLMRAQRRGFGEYRNIVRYQLAAHYSAVALIRGKNTSQRVQDSSAQYIKTHCEEIFGAILQSERKRFEELSERLQRDMRDAAKKIHGEISISVAHVQGPSGDQYRLKAERLPAMTSLSELVLPKLNKLADSMTARLI